MATVWINGVPQNVNSGTRLSDLLSSASHPCGGKGVCGKCRVQAEGALSPLSAEEQRHLTAFEVADGIRLSCCTFVQGDCRVTVAEERPMAVCADGAQPVMISAPAFCSYGVALDVGTTTIAARLYDTAGHLLAQEGCVNPQCAFGADVLSRAAAATQGKDVTTPLQQAVNGLLSRLATQAGIASDTVDFLVITGNTTMLCLLTATDATSLTKAPFALPRAFDEMVAASAMGLTAVAASAKAYLPPCVAPFVGADALCAALACGLGEDGRTALLADMGTNGEFVLSHKDGLYVCSTAAGPAFEGVGISHGMPAVNGAIDRVELVNGRLLPHTIGGGEAVGICGSGLVDAAACLLAAEEMDGSGCLQTASVRLTKDVYLTQTDIRVLQQSKSAVYAGLQTLLFRGEISADEVETLYVAGGFGSRLNGRNAAAIGLLPWTLASRIQPVGNAALDGAARLLLDTTARARVALLAQRAHVIPLATDPYFVEKFMRGMRF